MVEFYLTDRLPVPASGEMVVRVKDAKDVIGFLVRKVRYLPTAHDTCGGGECKLREDIICRVSPASKEQIELALGVKLPNTETMTTPVVLSGGTDVGIVYDVELSRWYECTIEAVSSIRKDLRALKEECTKLECALLGIPYEEWKDFVITETLTCCGYPDEKGRKLLAAKYGISMEQLPKSW